MKSYKDALST